MLVEEAFCPYFSWSMYDLPIQSSAPLSIDSLASLSLYLAGLGMNFIASLPLFYLWTLWHLVLFNWSIYALPSQVLARLSIDSLTWSAGLCSSRMSSIYECLISLQIDCPVGIFIVYRSTSGLLYQPLDHPSIDSLVCIKLIFI